MKKFSCTVSVFLLWICAHAQVDTMSYVYANSLYETGKYSQAIPIYGQLLKQNGSSSVIYYNLGNAYYKTNEIGNSILNYERCLKIHAGDEDAKYNLEIANLKIKDKLQPVDEFFLTTWWRVFFITFNTRTWIIISIVSIWIALAGFALFRIAARLAWRKIGFYTFSILSVVFCIALIATWSKSSYEKNYQYAVIMEPSSIIKSEPNESSTNLFILHEGLKLRILNTEGEWSEIKLADGSVGWLLTNTIEKI